MRHARKLTGPPSQAWPELPPLAEWEDTFATLHLWTQIVGKIRLELSPWTNHAWHVPFYVTPYGLTTSAIHDGGLTFEIDFDFVDHRLRAATSQGERRSFPLEPMTVADFHRKTMNALDELGIDARIWPMPVEIPGHVQPFPQDREHSAYDPAPVSLCWRAMLQVHRVFTAFRSRFIGKVSPVHMFWGAFDLAVTRFSGRRAPEHPGGAPNCPDWVMKEAYSHEVSSAGFWPGAGLGEAAFYSYAYPEPEGFRRWAVHPTEAYYHGDLGEFVLPYDVVRRSADPDETLMSFLKSTYEAAAYLGNWDRGALERARPISAPRRRAS